jgi:autotransporter adhesin
VALGEGSVANLDNTISVGSLGNERQIANVAPGTADTDAATMVQLQEVIDDLRAEIALFCN